jgi:hypothetical protein
VRKHPHKIRMAIARELCGFLWQIAARVARDGQMKPVTGRDTYVVRRRSRLLLGAAAPGSSRARAAARRAAH